MSGPPASAQAEGLHPGTVLAFVVQSGGGSLQFPPLKMGCRRPGVMGCWGDSGHAWQVFTEADGSSWGSQRGRAIPDGETEAGSGWPVGTLAQAGRSAWNTEDNPRGLPYPPKYQLLLTSPPQLHRGPQTCPQLLITAWTQVPGRGDLCPLRAPRPHHERSSVAGWPAVGAGRPAAGVDRWTEGHHTGPSPSPPLQATAIPQLLDFSLKQPRAPSCPGHGAARGAECGHYAGR